MPSVYEARVQGRTSEELPAAIEDGQPGSRVSELLTTALYGRALQETAAASNRVARWLNVLTFVVAVGTLVAALSAVWALIS